MHVYQGKIVFMLYKNLFPLENVKANLFDSTWIAKDNSGKMKKTCTAFANISLTTFYSENRASLRKHEANNVEPEDGKQNIQQFLTSSLYSKRFDYKFRRKMLKNC